MGDVRKTCKCAIASPCSELYSWIVEEYKMQEYKILPVERKCKSKLVWAELTKTWRSDRNLIKGFTLNLVKQGLLPISLVFVGAKVMH